MGMDELVEINFEFHPDFRSCFLTLDPVEIIQKIELTANVDIHPGKTLLFLDEIQESPQALKALRYFYEKMPALHVIAAGSLLEFLMDAERIFSATVISYRLGIVNTAICRRSHARPA
ncbi:MAG: AAA family ATPase [Desulfobacterales bacterium]|nr:AAA family ATPase [Desulfobacterales bacterium]